MATYINKKDAFTGELTTVKSLKHSGCSMWEFRGLCQELSEMENSDGHYYLSNRATKAFYTELKLRA